MISIAYMSRRTVVHSYIGFIMMEIKNVVIFIGKGQKFLRIETLSVCILGWS